MTPVQKVIKYFAIAFAIFLIVTIISAILSGGYMLLTAFGLINTNENINTINQELRVIPNDVKEVSSLKIDLACTNLNIKKGTDFKIETNNSEIQIKENNGNVEIKEKNLKWIGGNFLNSTTNSSDLTIYLPENLDILNETKIETDAGKINIEHLSTQILDLELGAGDVYLENITVIKKAKIDGGVGKTELKYCTINNLEADLGMGEFVYNGSLTGKNEIDAGVGSINMNLSDLKDDYKINVDRGVGKIKIDNNVVEHKTTYGSGNNYIEIDGGVGEININFENDIVI